MKYLLSLSIALCATTALAQEPEPAAEPSSPAYTEAEFDHWGEMEGALDPFRTSRITGGFAMTLVGETEADNLPVSGETAELFYSEDGQTLQRIVIDGNVVIDHPRAKITSDHADWNVESGVMIFTGNPVINAGATAKDLAVERVELNLTEGTWRTFGGRGGTVNFAAGENNPYLLAADDVSDWNALLQTFKTQAADDGPSPGKRMVEIMSPSQRMGFSNTSVDILADEQNREEVLRILNGILKNRALYDAAAWDGIVLDEDTQALLTQDTESLPALDVTRINRQLLHAAFPELVAPASPPESEE